MAAKVEQASQRNIQSQLVQDILQTGKSAFDPDSLPDTRRQGLVDFQALIEKASTLSLLPALNLLVQPNRVPPWLREPIITALARLPLRPRGVQHTIEFVFSVHPSTSSSKSDQRTGGGSSISHEALQAASRLLSSPPAGMNPDEWFQGIAPQLFSLLQGEGEPGIDNAAAFVIGFGILGRKQYGAPGTPGWKAFVEPLYRHIDPSLAPRQGRSSDEEIVVLGTSKVLSTADQVATSLHQLSTLLASHPNPSLTKRILRPVLLPLWSLAYWHSDGVRVEKQYRDPARKLLRALLQLTANNTMPQGSSTISGVTREILHNLAFNGRAEDTGIKWQFEIDEGGDGIKIIQRPDSSQTLIDELPRIETSVESFTRLLSSIPELSAEISTLFVELFRKWFSQNKDDIHEIRTRMDIERNDRVQLERLIEAKVVQSLIDSFPDKLVTNSTQVLEIIDQVFSEAAVEIKNEDTVAIALSLLNIILTSPSFKTKPEVEDTLHSIKQSLVSISRSQLDIATTAKNLLMLLQFRNAIEEPDALTQGPVKDQTTEDKKQYTLAMSYLTAFDSPPPVRVQGLDLLSGLIRSKSSVLDIPSVIVLFSSLLSDSEEYIYLRTIKSFIQLSERHPKAVLKDLIDRYVDSREEVDLDQRLRFGEALLQVIESRFLAFTNDVATTVCEGLLFVASRRGQRPKTEKSQERDLRAKRKQDELAKRAWDGEVPQLDEVLDLSPEEDGELIAQIVGGWESKRGSEDVRIRSSALSIIAGSIEANVGGISSAILSTTVDLCIHILTLEPEPEKGILRRAAILTILSFIRALDNARQQGNKLGFGLAGQSLEDIKRILGYVEESDNDGLVRQHAKDVIESLEAWQMNMLTPSNIKAQTNIEELAGLAINPSSERDEGRIRPRIEEIE